MSFTGARVGAAAALLALTLAACGGDDGEQAQGFKTGTGGAPSAKSDGGTPAAGVGSTTESARTTFLLSTAAGAFPNGPSRNAAVSHDQRIARYIAYESDASNIAEGDSNGATDVFLVFRAEPFGTNGTPWKPAGTQLISKAPDGSPANGASYRPVLDGDSHHTPHCVAFVSTASNLVSGDTNGKADGFVYDIRSRRITRVTVDSAGRQSNGSTYDISVDGACERVAFTSDASNLALTKTKNAAWSTARSTRVRRGSRQVYVHVMGGSGLDRGFKGLTFLASATSKGKAGNGDSGEAGIARSGKSVVFSSTARNLARGDRSGSLDIYRRTIFRKFERVRGKGVQTLQGETTLVSATSRGKAGNGPSSHPTITDDGRYVAYQTDASDLLPGDSNGVTDIARADLRNAARPKQEYVSKTPLEGIANGPSHNPVISDAGEFILFDSDATNLRPSESVKPDPNGVKDVFLWNAPTRNVSLESRNSENGYLESPSQHPATSSRGNYVPFESAYPLIDLSVAQQVFPRLIEQPAVLDTSILPKLSDPDVPAPELPVLGRVASFKATTSSTPDAEVAQAAAGAGQQIYLRYLGAK